MFDVHDKVAVVTGGLGGIGMAIVKELLRNGARGVMIIDVHIEIADQALDNLIEEFGPKKVIFIPANVSDYKAFENAFKHTLKQFNNIDILVNNAGIVDELDIQRGIAVNLTGTINGTLLAIENYILNHKSGEEGVILNTSSIAGIQFYPVLPMYSAAKFGIIGLTGSMGHEAHYERTKIKVIAICPGMTDTELRNDFTRVRPYCKEFVEEFRNAPPIQTPEAVAEVALDIIKNAKSGTVWVAEDGKGYEFQIPDRSSFLK